VSQSLDPKTIQYSYTDDALKTVTTRTSMLGTEMVTWAVSKEEAIKELSGEDVDLAIATLVRTGKIERSLETRKVVYKVSLADDDPAKYLAEGPTQSIRRISPNTVELTVTSIVPPETNAEEAEPADARYLSSNKFLQSDDELVVKFANEAVPADAQSWGAAQSMEKWVHQKVKDKNFSTLMASAAEVAKTLSGDCTEHACLLAAMCRAKKIPARIVVGLMYVPRDSAFGGHMWTEVYINGVWVPVDGTLGRGRVGADHIKFLDASFDDADAMDGMAAFVPVVSALGQMKIEVGEVGH
ncbi:MAG: transglutaminase family protein, partial [Planctomycetota bacterium]|nr:transglutaminase family protein [Planctomycetota bacterium]